VATSKPALRAASGPWFYAGADLLTGKPQYVRETHKTYAAAEVALTRLQGQVDEDRHPRGDLTIRQAVAQWLEVADLADTTRERYQDLIRLHILPVLGDRQADKLDVQVLDRLYARLQQCRDEYAANPVHRGLGTRRSWGGGLAGDVGWRLPSLRSGPRGRSAGLRQRGCGRP
jgi:Phage integrase, N-terminal SAM-like domain